MAKVRVYELARELGVETKQMVARIKAIGLPINSHQSTLTLEQVEQVKAALSGEVPAQKVAEKKPVAKVSKVVRRRRHVVKTESDGGSETTKEISEVVEIGSEKKTKLIRKTEAINVDGETQSIVNLDISEEAIAKKAQAEEAQNESSEEVAEQPQKQEEVSTSSEAKESTNDAQEAPKAEEEKPKRRLQASEGGAKIVRRATAKEREDLEKSSERRGGPSRQEDSRGVRVTGSGIKTNTGYSTDSSSGGAYSNSPMSNVGGFGADAKKGEKRYGESEADAKKKSAFRNKKTADRNALNLLKKVDIKDLDDIVVTKIGLGSAAPRRTYTPTGNRRSDLRRKKNLKQTQITTPRAELRVVEMGSSIKISEFAKQLSIKSNEIIKKLMAAGEMLSINDSIDLDTATLIANEYKYEVKSLEKSLTDILKAEKDEREVQPRPPVVTVMGHVDHGKTSVLDAIRKTSVASGEAGGITQHIGAYTVERDENLITFLDTPGHEAFSEMRSRGAKITDIVVLVVAADDGVMPQTIEAINHAKASEVPVIVAINKIDKGEKNLEKVFTQLAEYGVQSEEWGGETQFVKVSALQNIGLEELLDAILLQSEVLDLKSPHEGKAGGVVIESHLDIGRGPVATVLVTDGTMKIGDFVVAGTVSGRVRSMKDHRGNDLTDATPSVPVEITGLEGVPNAGDPVNAVESEKTAKEVIQWRERKAIELGQAGKANTMDALLSKMKEGEALSLPVVIKADAQGSAEAIADSLAKLNTEQVSAQIVHKAVGGVSESDIRLAETSGAVIVAFNVRASRGLDQLAEKLGVTINYFNVIYDLVDSVKTLMAGKLPSIKKEIIQGHAEVRDLISISKVGNIAGSSVLDGKIIRGSNLRLLRDSVVVFEGKLGSLRRFKEDVKEVASGFECGITINGFNDIKLGDVIEAFVVEEEAATL